MKKDKVKGLIHESHDGEFNYRGVVFIIDDHEKGEERFIITESNFMIQVRGEVLEEVKKVAKALWDKFLKERQENKGDLKKREESKGADFVKKFLKIEAETKDHLVDSVEYAVKGFNMTFTNNVNNLDKPVKNGCLEEGKITIF